MPYKRHMRPTPSQAWLQESFDYNPETGVMVRRWDGRNVYAIQSSGYYAVAILGGQFLAHRVIWKYVYGVEAEWHIDHINGDRHDNRISNLRLAVGVGNFLNKKLTVQNKSGLKGACWCNRRKKWRANIKVGQKQVHLGQFDTKEEAHAAYVEAAKKYHGAFANDGFGPICP